MSTIINSIIPVFFVIFLGWLSGRNKIVGTEYKKAFADYVMMFSFPLLLFLHSYHADPKDLLDIRMVVTFTLSLMGIYVISYVASKFIFKYNSKESAQTAIVCAFPNMAFMGIPMLSSLIGPKALISIAIGNIITSLFMIPVTTIILESDKEGQSNVAAVIKASLVKCITKPLIVAPVLGVIASLSGLELPKVIDSSFLLIGKSTSGVSLFSLGLIMASFQIKVSRKAIFNIIIKNILHPIFAGILLLIFNLKGLMAKEILLLCAMPTATISNMFALKYEVLEEESSSATILGTLISLGTLSVIIYYIM